MSLRKCAWLLGLVLCAAGAWWFLRPHGYRATARVEVKGPVNPGPWFIQCEFERIQCYLILSNAVRQLTNAKDGTVVVDEAVQRLRQRLEFHVVSEDVFDICIRDKRPEEACRIVNAVAEAYRGWFTAQGHDGGHPFLRKITFATPPGSSSPSAYRPENQRQADEARPPSPVAEATGPGGGTQQADGTRAALSNSVPLYVHFGVGFEPTKRLLYTRIHLGEPIFVGGDDSWELTGKIEERGTNLVADLKGSDGAQAGFYRGTVTPEQAVHIQGGIFSGGVYSMWFLVSTNTGSEPVLQRVEEMSKRMFGR